MAIFRNGARVYRALTTTSSSCSTDEEELMLPERESMECTTQQSMNEAPAAGYYQLNTRNISNRFQIGEITCQLPEEIFDLSRLSDVISFRSWNDCLSEQERQQLCTYLPPMDEELLQRTLNEVFSGQNLWFGNPSEILWQQLKNGSCDANVVEARRALISLQKADYFRNLHSYHSEMLNSLKEMRDLWASDPEGNLIEKLKSWKIEKSSKTMKAFQSTSCDTSKLDPLSKHAGHVDDDMQTAETNMKDDLLGYEKGRYTCGSNFVLNKALSTTRRKIKTSTATRDQADIDQIVTNSKRKLFLISKERQCVERKSGFMETPAHTGKKARIASKSMKNLHASSACHYGKLDELSMRHDGFTFSILKFLSAVRFCFVNDAALAIDGLPFKETVAKVKACPGDSRVLKLQAPLDCMVRGVLKVLASCSEELCMDGFEALVFYDKAKRLWSWAGPTSSKLCTFREGDLQAMSEAWGISSTVLEELENRFGKWLNINEKTLQQLWQLSQLPLPVFPFFSDQKERFRGLRAQKSLRTIPVSTHEVKELFQKEEQVRYSTSEMAFHYTAIDGQKSTVAPRRKLGQKPKGKARNHFMLKPDRPSDISILCLVRDAAARLPNGIGTKADICTLLKDSQFIQSVPDDPQLNHVVSCALDRLQQEVDPCVQYDQDSKLWLYLHGNREEEDFEEGGTRCRRSFQRSKRGSGGVLGSPTGQCKSHLTFPDQESSISDLSSLKDKNGQPSAMDNHLPWQRQDKLILPDLNIDPSMVPSPSHTMEVTQTGSESSSCGAAEVNETG